MRNHGALGLVPQRRQDQNREGCLSCVLWQEPRAHALGDRWSQRHLDLAFEAHASITRHWALAVWDRWFDTQHMQTSLDAARHKLARAKGSWWALVAGPTTALLATLRRLGWKCVNATTLVTDEGRNLDLTWTPLLWSPTR